MIVMIILPTRELIIDIVIRECQLAKVDQKRTRILMIISPVNQSSTKFLTWITYLGAVSQGGISSSDMASVREGRRPYGSCLHLLRHRSLARILCAGRCFLLLLNIRRTHLHIHALAAVLLVDSNELPLAAPTAPAAPEEVMAQAFQARAPCYIVLGRAAVSKERRKDLDKEIEEQLAKVCCLLCFLYCML